ncbi:MAG: hypothetical protein H0U78_03190 [Rickettsiaceae bacterium]|jgi:hypothetical protein|nr:hypothetical protein [Rickettsiaceae bacterium]
MDKIFSTARLDTNIYKILQDFFGESSIGESYNIPSTIMGYTRGYNMPEAEEDISLAGIIDINEVSIIIQ